MKTLRLTFAMGGGVSLGSFSGAALTEILRALVLHGQDRNGVKYDRVVLDSMSGASAGAIALSILMRSLMDYKATAATITEFYEAKITNPKQSANFYTLVRKQNTGIGQELEDFLDVVGQKIDKLIEENNISSNGEKEKIKEQLVAIEIAQMLQEILWVKEVNINSLLKQNKKKSKLENFSLLPRDTIVALTKKYLLPNSNSPFDLENLSILGNRVLFVCSLTNLVPNRMVENVDGIDLKHFPQIREVKRALNSKSHEELRVFDFKLKPKHQLEFNSKEFNWLEITATQINDNKNPLNLSINSKKAWARIAATVIACGAFPVAFAPVILKRWKREFPQYWNTPKNDVAQQYNSVWELPKIEEHKLPYVDGGTFNNEPIREAFRLANYIDTNLRMNKNFEEKENPFDRLVVFVDPIVDSGDLSYNMRSYSDLAAKIKRRSLKKTINQGTFNRMTSLTSQLISMLRHQGAVKEEHKISDYLDKVRLRAKLRNHLNQLYIPIDDSTEELALFKEIVYHVDRVLMRGIIPLGTRDIGKYLFWTAQAALSEEVEITNFQDEGLERKIFEKPNAFFDKIGKQKAKKLAELFGLLKNNKSNQRGLEKSNENTLTCEQFSELVNKLKSSNPKETKFSEVFDTVFYKENDYYESLKDFIKRLFLSITIDAGLDIDGKDPKAVRLAITPIAFDLDGKSEAKTIALPGSEIQAFGGFTSRASREYAFQYGRYCALESLKRTDFRKYYEALNINSSINTNTDDSPHPFIPENAFQKSLSNLKSLLSDSSEHPAEKNLNDDLSLDADSLKKNWTLQPIWKRLSQLFPRTKALLIKLIAVIIGLFITVLLATLIAQKDLSFWSFIISSSFGVSVIALGIIGYLIYSYFDSKKTFKGFIINEMESFSNYEITLLLPKLGPTDKIKAVRFNNSNKYIKALPIKYQDLNCQGIKLFIRQIENNGYQREYDLYISNRSLRNWRISPLNSFKKSLNQSEKDFQKVEHIHFTSKNWFGRFFSFSKRKETGVPIAKNSIQHEKVEWLKFYIDPAIILEKNKEQFFFKYDCLTEELEEIILSDNE